MTSWRTRLGCKRLESEVFKKWDQKKLYLVFGMLNSKNPRDFLNFFKKISTKLITVSIKSESPYYPNKKLYEIAKLNEFNVETAETIKHAINNEEIFVLTDNILQKNFLVRINKETDPIIKNESIIFLIHLILISFFLHS